jgi:hypothetical protein
VTPGTIQFVLIGTLALVAMVVIVYPLLSGQLRVGATTVRRESDPTAFWRGCSHAQSTWIRSLGALAPIDSVWA